MKRFLLALGLVAAIPAACTSSSNPPPAGDNDAGGSCQPPGISAACESCLSAHCSSESTTAGVDCAAIVSCYCACNLGDTCCVEACASDVTSACVSGAENLATCANTSCAASCTVTVPGACTDAGATDAGHDSGTEGGTPGGDAGAGTLWVTDNFSATTPTPSILGFSLAEAAAGGNVAPRTTISGANTTMTGPGCVAFDASGNMWVVDSPGSKQAGQILEFTAANVASGGNVAPAVTISGDSTQLTNPAGCAFDSNGTLWMAVIDNLTPNVVAFTAAQLATGGNIAPAIEYANGCNTIDVAFDPTGDLWVSALCTGIEEFTKAELTDGGASPTPVLNFGQATGVNGITFDSAGNLWTAMQGGVNAVTEFTPTELTALAADAASPQASLQISGTATQMNAPFGLTFANGSLWVVQQGSNALTQYDVTGLVDGGGLAPTAVVTGANTGLNSPSFILFH